MAMETHVVFSSDKPDPTALQAAFDALGFPLSFPPDTGSLDNQSGYLPMLLRGAESGIELDYFECAEMVSEFDELDFDPAAKHWVSFRWGGDEDEMRVALCMAAAFAHATGGKVVDEFEYVLLSAEEAVTMARESLG